MEGERINPQSFGELLRVYRKRSRLTQKQLAERLALHANSISSWELGTYLPQTRGLVLEAARQLALSDQETRQLLEASLTTLSPHWHLPSPRNPFFTGREDILEVMHQRLSTGEEGALTPSYVLYGLGGVGKTQIALEYAYRYAQEYTAVFWIGAESLESITSSYLSIATLLGLPEPRESDQDQIMAAVRAWLGSHRHWLLVWDNVEDLDMLSTFLPSARQGAMLFTTRRQTLGTLATGMELQPMREAEGMLFLFRRASLLDLFAQEEQVEQLAQSRPADYAAAQALVAEMDGLPLALDQVGAYVQETSCSLVTYLDLYHMRQAELLKRRGEMILDHPTSVATTWSLSFEKVERANSAAAELLRRCAFLHPDAIPEELFLENTTLLRGPSGPLVVDTLEWDAALQTALTYSLLKRNPENHTLSMHRLVQAVLRERMGEHERKRVQHEVIRTLNAHFPEVTPATRNLCERLLPHVLTCAAAMPEQIEHQALAEVLRKAADFLRERGQGEQIAPAGNGSQMPGNALPAVPGKPPDANQQPYPVHPSQTLSLRARQPSQFPLIKGMSARKQMLWMGTYALLELLCWAPYFIVYQSEVLTTIYFLFFCLLLLPASVLLAGILFGWWRGVLMTICYAGSIAALGVLTIFLQDKTSPGRDALAFGVLFCAWPLASLVTGRLAQRVLFRGFGAAYATMLVGVSIILLGVAIGFWIAGPGSNASDSVPILGYDVTVLCMVPLITPLLALPLAALEEFLQLSIARAKKHFPQLW